MIIGWIMGVILMPGANGSFQHWHGHYTPMLLAMAGVPLEVTFWVYHYLFPVNIYDFEDPGPQHIMFLALTAYLVLVKDSLSSPKAEEKPMKKIKEN